MIGHLIAWTAGFLLDRVLGDPQGMPHPVRLIGGYIGFLEKRLNVDTCSSRAKRARGVILVLLVLLPVFGITLGLTILTYRIHPIAGIITETILTYYLLAGKSLTVESMLVSEALETDGLSAGRYAVSRIVGRDTESLSEAGVIRAAVETVAENTSDGVIAPMLFSLIGGPMFGWCYKAVNTMDSMVGYKSDKFFDFGRAAAKTDDIVNFIPARFSAILMILSAYVLPGFRGKDAARIWKRDRRNHASPNSAQTESVCAGALGVELAGNASYFGKAVEKPTIGNPMREIEITDIEKANRLMFCTSLFCLLFGVCLLAIALLIIGKYFSV